MSGTPNRASQPPAGKSRKKDVTLDLNTARQMLPLVRSIVTDIVSARTRLVTLVPEQERLERNRRALDWAARERRYALQDELATAEKHFATAITELSALGVRLQDADAGRVAFPTRINGRPAAFSWQLGEDALAHWQYADDDTRRQIPADWQSGAPIRHRGEP